MNIQTVAQNLRTAIAGKEAMLERSKTRLAQRPTPDDVTWFTIKSTVQLLENNIAELKMILSDVEACATEQSWRDNPDRSGGQFTQDEIVNDGRWI